LKLGAKRTVLLCLAWVFVALGVIGAVLPVIPTAPFMLVALWLFGKSSERFHGWLYNHPLFGPPLQRWEQHRVIPLSAKVMAITAMSISMISVVAFSGAPWIAQIGMGAFCVLSAAFILSCPSRPPEQE
jgi:uncharacterized membrane protein YbaN (DUF454 family)